MEEIDPIKNYKRRSLSKVNKGKKKLCSYLTTIFDKKHLFIHLLLLFIDLLVERSSDKRLKESSAASTILRDVTNCK